MTKLERIESRFFITFDHQAKTWDLRLRTPVESISIARSGSRNDLAMRRVIIASELHRVTCRGLGGDS